MRERTCEVADEVLVVAGAFRASRSLPFLTNVASDAGRDQWFLVPEWRWGRPPDGTSLPWLEESSQN